MHRSVSLRAILAIWHPTIIRWRVWRRQKRQFEVIDRFKFFGHRLSIKQISNCLTTNLSGFKLAIAKPRPCSLPNP
jgi:hypothetical protein